MQEAVKQEEVGKEGIDKCYEYDSEYYEYEYENAKLHNKEKRNLIASTGLSILAIVIFVSSLTVGKERVGRRLFEGTDINSTRNETADGELNRRGYECTSEALTLKFQDRAKFIPLLIPSSVFVFIMVNFLGLYYYLYMKEKQKDAAMMRGTHYGSHELLVRGSTQTLDDSNIAPRGSDYDPFLDDAEGKFKSPRPLKTKDGKHPHFTQWAEFAFHDSPPKPASPTALRQNRNVFFD